MPLFATDYRVSAGQTAANPQIVRQVITQMPTRAPLPGTGSSHRYPRAGATGTIGHHPATGVANPGKSRILGCSQTPRHHRWCVLTPRNGAQNGGNYTRSLCRAVAFTTYATEEF